VECEETSEEAKDGGGRGGKLEDGGGRKGRWTMREERGQRERVRAEGRTRGRKFVLGQGGYRKRGVAFGVSKETGAGRGRWRLESRERRSVDAAKS